MRTLAEMQEQVQRLTAEIRKRTERKPADLAFGEYRCEVSVEVVAGTERGAMEAAERVKKVLEAAGEPTSAVRFGVVEPMLIATED